MHQNNERLSTEETLKWFQNSRRNFLFPVNELDQPKTYLCGNSLGLQPKTVREQIQEELQRWAQLGIDGYFEGDTAWLHYADLCKPELARLTGARPAEVALMNSLTTNLHLLMVSFYQPRGRRRKILIEHQAFPSDHYAVASQLRWHGFSPSEDLIILKPDLPGGVFSSEHILATIEQHAQELALILLPAVQYVSGQWLPMKDVTALAEKHEIPIGWDCAHATGNVPLALHEWGADFAVGCSYKYLNGGPGAPGWAFVHDKHHGRTMPRLTGWWGNNPQTRFAMAPTFDPAAGIDAWQLSNVPILAAVAVLAGLEVFSPIPVSALRAQSLHLHAALRAVLERHPDVEMLTPETAEAHGCQLSFGLRSGRESTRALFEHLLANDIVGDWREPGIIRLSPVPLYNSLEDIAQVDKSLTAYFETAGRSG